MRQHRPGFIKVRRLTPTSQKLDLWCCRTAKEQPNSHQGIPDLSIRKLRSPNLGVQVRAVFDVFWQSDLNLLFDALDEIVLVNPDSDAPATGVELHAISDDAHLRRPKRIDVSQSPVIPLMPVQELKWLNYRIAPSWEWLEVHANRTEVVFMGFHARFFFQRARFAASAISRRRALLSFFARAFPPLRANSSSVIGAG